MYGPAGTQAPGVNGATVTNLSASASGMGATGRAQAYSSLQGSLPQTPWWLLGIAIVYLIYALALQHERVKQAIQPANIAANLHNILIVTLMAVIGIVLGKIGTTKLAALNIPGAAQLAQIFAAV